MTTAAEVISALRLRWPDGEYVTLTEAPEDSMRAGRKIDMLAVACWASRNFAVDAVEVKVSMSDWTRELQNSGKADFWWRHSNRFWVAVPTAIAGKVRETLPAGWGLLACAPDTKPHVVVAGHYREAEPWSMSTVVGLLRASGNAGIGALDRARSAGYSEGREVGRREGATREAQRLREELDALKGRVAAFEAASGVRLDAWQGWPDQFNAEWAGKATRRVVGFIRDEETLADLIRRAQTKARSLADIAPTLIDAGEGAA